MSGRANDLITIPDSLWRRPETVSALRSRDIGRFFALVSQYAGASQTQIGIACGMTQGKVSFIMRGIRQVEHLEVFERIADGLHMPDAARMALGLAPRSPASAQPPPVTTPVRGRPASDMPPVRRLLDPDEEDRRAQTGPVPFASVLAGHADSEAEPAGPPDVSALTAEVTRAMRQYQGCRYSELTRKLPGLLACLHAASAALAGDARNQVLALSADAHHVAAGILLKLGDQGLAYLAADRSRRAALASEDPVTIAASARIVTHTLMNGGHLAAAFSNASTCAARLDREMSPQSPESLSVYGSLLLRGSVAAAQNEKRAAAHELLEEAEDAARRLGTDGNLRWTAFGPANAALHRVNISVVLGDAGAAIDTARRIDLSKLTVTERKANLFIDAARAFLQRGRHEKAYFALRTAEQTAHEEVSDRPSVRKVIRELLITAPPGIRRDVTEFASQIGVSGDW